MVQRRTVSFILGAALTAASLTTLGGPAQAADESITVNFSVAGASPTYRGSGWIYGMTEDASAPADHFYRDVKFQAMRAGGAQLDSPGGWVSGKYDRRWNATRAQLLRTRALGGQFVLLVHDLWGADGFPISRFPGDNGDWTDFDNFLTRLINDVRATSAPVEWDLWNEPNISIFWNRPQAQYFELWRRAYQRMRAAFPTHLIVGPSCACVPSTSGWWTQYLDFVRANNVIPDIVSWHALPGDPVANVAAANTTLDPRGIPHPRPYQINEYAAPNEQSPAGGSWYLARLERAGADGLRANWAGGANLHNRPGRPAGPQLVRAAPAEGRMVGLPLLRLTNRPARVRHAQPGLRRGRHQGGRGGEDPRRRARHDRQHRGLPAAPGYHERHRAEQPGAGARPAHPVQWRRRGDRPDHHPEHRGDVV